MISLKTKRLPTLKKQFGSLGILLVSLAAGLGLGFLLYTFYSPTPSSTERNVKRLEDVNTILKVVNQYFLNHQGTLPDTIPLRPKEICITRADCEGLVDLSVLTNYGAYLSSLPKDPKESSKNGTGYFISRTRNGRVIVEAPHAEQGITIRVSR